MAAGRISAAEFAADSELFRFLTHWRLSAWSACWILLAEARTAISQCRNAGIQVKMITGDQKVTANAIALKLELEGKMLDGSKLAAMDERRFADHIAEIGFSPALHRNKNVRIIQA